MLTCSSFERLLLWRWVSRFRSFISNQHTMQVFVFFFFFLSCHWPPRLDFLLTFGLLTSRTLKIQERCLDWEQWIRSLWQSHIFFYYSLIPQKMKTMHDWAEANFFLPVFGSWRVLMWSVCAADICQCAVFPFTCIRLVLTWQRGLGSFEHAHSYLTLTSDLRIAPPTPALRGNTCL